MNQKCNFSTLLSIILFAVTGAAISMPASADDFVWTGKAYIPIPAVFNQDVVISFPEPVTISLQQPSADETQNLDDHTIQLRPKVQEQEQRAIFRGKKSGKIYYGKVSSRLPYVPNRDVIDGTASAQEERATAAGNTQLGLMRAMMTPNGIPPQGFEEQSSQKVMLNMAPFKITARSVWSAPGMVGIIATLASTVPGATIPIVPTNIQMSVPEYGALRILGADAWELSPSYPSTRIYLIFSR